MRDHILMEIRRLAGENRGKPPGRNTFTRATGIKRAQWHHVIWAQWSDALAEAGFAPDPNRRYDDIPVLLRKIGEFSLLLGRLPTRAEMQLRRKADPSFPRKGAILTYFPTDTHLTAALREFAAANDDGRLLALLPDGARQRQT
jgi:hypothetical protein